MKNILWVLIIGVGSYFGYEEILVYQKKVEVQNVYLKLDKLYRAQQANYFRAGRYIGTLKEVGIKELSKSGYKVVMSVAKDGLSYSATATNGLNTFTIDSNGKFAESIPSRAPSSL